MGCGCGRNKAASNLPNRNPNPATQINQLPRGINPIDPNAQLNPSQNGTNTNNVPRTMINSDRVRVERLRREAISRAKENKNF